MAKTYIYGKHAVFEALTHAPHIVEQVYISEVQDDDRFHSLLNKINSKVTRYRRGDMPKALEREIGADAAHQGVIAVIAPAKLMRNFKEFLQGLEPTSETMVVILGELQDIQNVGAIIRSAAAFGAAAVLIPEHDQAQINGAVIKVSAGMAFRMPLVAISNINNSLRELKEKGFYVYGLEGGPKNHRLTKETFDSPSAFIFGNEAEGIRQKTRELCDILLSIPMHPRCESLNVSASAAATLYAWSAQHPPQRPALASEAY